ncbi:hypothetical protein NL676_008603 [Syzygium grande]|nr:hypothetical protein NL676_008603 [Syzygium grande]
MQLFKLLRKWKLEMVLQIDQRDVEEAVDDETDGQGTELKSKRILIVKVVKKEETEEELENADIYIERPESAKELYNGESEFARGKFGRAVA